MSELTPIQVDVIMDKIAWQRRTDVEVSLELYEFATLYIKVSPAFKQKMLSSAMIIIDDYHLERIFL